jgi:hypothetical protein
MPHVNKQNHITDRGLLKVFKRMVFNNRFNIFLFVRPLCSYFQLTTFHS